MILIDALGTDSSEAYTRYSFFEWGLVILDVLFDAAAEEDFRVGSG